MIDPKRILIRQDPDKEGIIELRPNVKDISLGDKLYNMVRIWIGPSNKYIKGLAVYSDEIPPEYDIIFYTRIRNDGSLLGFKTGRRIHSGPNKTKPFTIVEAPEAEWEEWKEEYWHGKL